MNIYNNFRRVEILTKENSFSKRFDEPTYFSFKLLFSQDDDRAYNDANNNNYNLMPHPLFGIGTPGTTIPSLDFTSGKPGRPPTPGGIPFLTYTTQPTNTDFYYSAINYLQNANEPIRAELLREFILKFRELENNYQYYFQSIEGISELLKINTTNGQRITSDKKISVTCLEGLDLRMSYLLNLYRKIAWDDVYQRWILPDMMRYFTLKIYLAEFRTFHQSVTDSAANSYNISESNPVILQVLDNIFPVWEILCEMCEFDINDITNDNITNNLNIAAMPNQGAVKFGIKVGNIKETQLYPSFKYKFLSDKRLNAVNRADENEMQKIIDGENSYYNKAILGIAQNIPDNADQHISGMPFNERANQDTTPEVRYTQSNIYNDKIPTNQDSTKPNTWIGNAIDIGTAYAKNLVNKIVDKGKTIIIPGLGVSYTEVTTALQSKNIVSALGLIRKGINEVANEYNNAPSSHLSQPIQTEMIFNEFLVSISKMSKSEATDKDTIALIEAANIVLSDKGLWEKIKDYSLATDLIGFSNGEVDITKKLQNANQYRDIVKTESTFKPTLQTGQIIEAQPSTSMFKTLENESLTQPSVSKATNNILQP